MAALSLARILFLLPRIIFLLGTILFQAIMLFTFLAITVIAMIYLAETIDDITVWYPNEPYMSPA